MPEHSIELQATWQGTIDGEGDFTNGNLDNHFTIPKNLAGKGHGTNPEELLLASAMSCYLITLAIGLKKKNISFEKLELNSSMTYSVGMALKIERIAHHPTIVGASSDDKAELEKLMHSADQYCMVSQALKGNVQIEVVTGS